MQLKTTILLICLTLASCGGLNSFNEYARVGDTVAVPVGMKPNFSKNNIIVTITPSSGPDIILESSHPAIRAIINLYPDPVSNMIVSREISEDTIAFASAYADSTLYSANSDKDYFQTTVFIDLPLSLPVGLTQIEVANDSGTIHAVTLDIIPGTGTANSFNADIGGGLQLTDAMLDSLARAPHTTVTLHSNVIPHAAELTFTHDPDKTVGGSGQAFVINPLGYRKNLSWIDDGVTIKVIMMQSKDGIINDMQDYKFYISGTATNLQLVSVDGYDSNGNDIVGVTSTLISSN